MVVAAGIVCIGVVDFPIDFVVVGVVVRAVYVEITRSVEAHKLK